MKNNFSKSYDFLIKIFPKNCSNQLVRIKSELDLYDNENKFFEIVEKEVELLAISNLHGDKEYDRRVFNLIYSIHKLYINGKLYSSLKFLTLLNAFILDEYNIFEDKESELYLEQNYLIEFFNFINQIVYQIYEKFDASLISEKYDYLVTLTEFYKHIALKFRVFDIEDTSKNYTKIENGNTYLLENHKKIKHVPNLHKDRLILFLYILKHRKISKKDFEKTFKELEDYCQEIFSFYKKLQIKKISKTSKHTISKYLNNNNTFKDLISGILELSGYLNGDYDEHDEDIKVVQEFIEYCKEKCEF